MMAVLSMAAASTLAALAIVTQDQSALRASSRDTAAQQAVLWQGDALEIRGERMDYLQVYDHRRERAGYIRASQVRTTSLAEADAPALLSVLRFVRDTPGSEALGISYAAAYLKAAPAQEITAEPFDALGTMAERLARRASLRQGKAETIAAHLEVATSYGVTFNSYERDATVQLCYDGEAFRRVLALPSTAPQRARAALALTRHDCIDPKLSATQRTQLDRRRAEVLDKVDAAQFASLSELLKNRLHLRRAGVWSMLAFEQARRAEPAALEAQRALQELAAVNKAELTDDDALDYSDAAVRVNASRWAAGNVAPSSARLTIATAAGQPGETCVMLVDAKHDVSNPLAKRCTYGIVWNASASTSPAGNAVALAVQPLDTWRELWLFRRRGDAWVIDVLPPSANEPDLGYVEFAGWVPGGERMLVAREATLQGRIKRSFEVMRLDTLSAEKQASDPGLLVLFGRWQDPMWKRLTVSLR